VALLLAVNLPIVVGTVRALARGWQPLGDNGLLLVRVRDVGTSHHPLLGSWSSSSIVVGEDLNNPGPLYFDLVAPFVKLLGPWVGVAVGVMLLNMAAASLAVVAARRISGSSSMVAVAVVVVGLQWVLGSELLFDLWQPNALVLPFFAFLVVATALATGDVAMAPWVVGLGGLVVQTHMGHLALVAELTLAAAAIAGWNLYQRSERPDWRRPALWTTAVLAVVWIQTLFEQVAGPGKGNLSRIAGAAGGGETTMFGPARSVRIVTEVFIGPWFTRSSYANAVPTSDPSDPLLSMPSAPAAVVILALLSAGLVGIAVVALRADRRELATLVVMATVALVGAIVALAASPINVVGIAVHQMRWLWPVAALVTAAALSALFAAVRDRPTLFRAGLVGSTAVALVVAVANLQTHPAEGVSPAMEADRLRQAQELVGQLDTLQGTGTVRFDPTGLRLAEPFSGLVLAELQDLGVPFVVDGEVLVRQLGEGRRDEGEAEYSLRQVEGTGVFEVPADAQRIAFVDGLSPAERQELRTIEERLRDEDSRPDDAARRAALEERLESGAVALFLEPIR
jgi:hypothetical protein